MTSPVLRATRRLSGQLVATPVIGELRIPGFDVAPTVRVKAECLQSTGSLWYRGCLHYLLVSLGRFKGIVLQGSPRALVAQAWAGSLHRLPMVRVRTATPDAAEQAWGVDVMLRDLGVDLVAAASAEQLAVDRGFQLFPGVEDPELAAGLGTLGVELAAELPADVERVVLAESAWVAAVQAGMDAADRACTVSALDRAGELAAGIPPQWGPALAAGLRLVPDAASAAALWWERDAPAPTCVVL